MKNNIVALEDRAGNRRSGRNRLYVGQLVLGLLSAAACHAAVFSEDVGVPSSTTSINNYSGWQNNGTLTFTGSGDVRTTSDSAGHYTGASGSGNVFLGAGGTIDLVIGSINTAGYKSLVLSFGAFKSLTASTMSELSLGYSVDGGASFTPLAIPLQPSGTGTAVWRLISDISLPSNAEGIPDLRLQWINTAASGGVFFRLDDITLGVTPVPEPITTAGILFAALFTVVQLGRFLHRRIAAAAPC